MSWRALAAARFDKIYEVKVEEKVQTERDAGLNPYCKTESWVSSSSKAVVHSSEFGDLDTGDLVALAEARFQNTA